MWENKEHWKVLQCEIFCRQRTRMSNAKSRSSGARVHTHTDRPTERTPATLGTRRQMHSAWNKTKKKCIDKVCPLCLVYCTIHDVCESSRMECRHRFSLPYVPRPFTIYLRPRFLQRFLFLLSRLFRSFVFLMHSYFSHETSKLEMTEEKKKCEKLFTTKFNTIVPSNSVW